MIQTAQDDDVATVNATYEALVEWIDMCEWDQGDTEEITILKVEIAKLMNEVNYLKSTTMWSKCLRLPLDKLNK